jgi:hypothetical protein
MYYVRNAVHKYIDTQIEPGDLVAIIRTAGGIGALQQFTTDKRLLHMAADRLVWDFRSRSGIGGLPLPTTETCPPARVRATPTRFRGSLASVGSMAALDFIATRGRIATTGGSASCTSPKDSNRSSGIAWGSEPRQRRIWAADVAHARPRQRVGRGDLHESMRGALQTGK